MFVLSKRNVILRSADGGTIRLFKDQMSTVPEHFTGTEFFRDLVADGLIITVDSVKDSAVQKEIDKAEVKEKKARKRAEKKGE